MGNSGGRFVWYELATTDIEAAKAFYASVLGWGTSDALRPGSGYSQFTAGGSPVAGLMKLPADAGRTGVAPQWLGFVGVDDVDVTAGRVEQLGGTVHVPPTHVPNAPRFSIVTDPQMAPLALVKRPERGRERSVQPTGPGHVVWHELLSPDVERAFAFYSSLLGWKKTEADVDSTGTYQHFSDGTETIGGIYTIPEMPSMSHWLYYFNVAGIEAAAKRVEAGGGQILYGPITVPGGARVVHCRDPQGAQFALIDGRVTVAIGCYSPRAPSHRPG